MSPAKRLPFYARAAYHHESRYSFLRGLFSGTLLFLPPLVTEMVLDGTEWHLAVLTCAFPAGMMLAPMWAQVGRRVGMKRLVLWPAACIACVVASLAMLSSVTSFVAVVCVALFLFSPVIVGETSLYKANYPDSHRNRAVGLIRSLSYGGVGVATLVAGWLMQWSFMYRVLFPVAACAGLLALLRYRRIRVRPQHEYWRRPADAGTRLGVAEALGVLRKDRRFAAYEVGYCLSGLANFVSFFLVVKVLDDNVHAGRFVAMLVTAVIPMATQVVSARLWGPLLDRLTPVSSHMIFSTLSIAAYLSFLAGALTGTLWPFFMGSVLRGASIGGGAINWSTGSMFFAPADKVNTYAGIHIGITGIRGSFGPYLGAMLFGTMGVWVFSVSAGLCVCSVLVMFSLIASRKIGVTRIEPAVSVPAGRV